MLVSAVGILYIIMHILLTTETLEDLWKKSLIELESHIQSLLILVSINLILVFSSLDWQRKTELNDLQFLQFNLNLIVLKSGLEPFQKKSWQKRNLNPLRMIM